MCGVCPARATTINMYISTCITFDCIYHTRRAAAIVRQCERIDETGQRTCSQNRPACLAAEGRGPCLAIRNYHRLVIRAACGAEASSCGLEEALARGHRNPLCPARTRDPYRRLHFRSDTNRTRTVTRYIRAGCVYINPRRLQTYSGWRLHHTMLQGDQREILQENMHIHRLMLAVWLHESRWQIWAGRVSQWLPPVNTEDVVSHGIHLSPNVSQRRRQNSNICL